MILGAAILLAAYTGPSPEIVISDCTRKISWLPDGTKAKSYAPPRWLDENWKMWAEAIEKRKPDERVVMVRVPYTVDAPSFFFQFPNGGRVSAAGTTTLWRPVRCWIGIFILPANAAQDEGLYEFGIASDPWKVAGTQWPREKRASGVKFDLQAKPSKHSNLWTFESALPDAPRHLAWRFVPYGNSGEPLGAAGTIRLKPGVPKTLMFTSGTPRNSISRIEFQRRPIAWTKFANIFLTGPL